MKWVQRRDLGKRRRHGRRWSESELADIRGRYGHVAPAVIAADLGRTVPAIWQCALRLGLVNHFDYRTPPWKLYRAMLRNECLANGVEYRDALSTKCQRREVVQARRRVFRQLAEAGYAQTGVASAAGFTHHVRIGVGGV